MMGYLHCVDLLSRSASRIEETFVEEFFRKAEYSHGTDSTGAKLPKPAPQTARPSGVFWSPPTPRPGIIGSL